MMAYFEYSFFAVICFFPFMLLAFYPLQYFKRFNTRTMISLELAGAALQTIAFVLFFIYFPDQPIYFVMGITIFNLLDYVLLFKVHFGRILFNLEMIVNYANFTVIFSKLLESIIFPGAPSHLFHWTYTVCILITEIIFILPIFLFMKKMSDNMIRDTSIDFVWRSAWLLPFMFSVIGLTTFYRSGSYNANSVNYTYRSSMFCGILVVCQLLIYYYVAKIIRQHQSVLKLEKDLYHQSLQSVQYKRIDEQIRETRVLRHDLRHHIKLICNYVDQKEYDKLSDYVHQYNQSITQISQLHYTDHSVLNAILVYLADMCRSSHIQLDVSLAMPSDLPLSDSDTTILFGNLLENAYQACLEQEDTALRSIRIRGSLKMNTFLFVIDNTFCNTLKQDQAGNFTTTKTHGSGIGLSSVKQILQEHDGYFDIQTDHQIFSVSFSLPIPEISKSTTS